MPLSEREKGKKHQGLVSRALRQHFRKRGHEYIVGEIVKGFTGYPDLIFVNKKNKRAELLVEVKTNYRALLQNQKKKIKELEKQGFTIRVCRLMTRDKIIWVEDTNGNRLYSLKI